MRPLLIGIPLLLLMAACAPAATPVPRLRPLASEGGAPSAEELKAAPPVGAPPAAPPAVERTVAAPPAPSR